MSETIYQAVYRPASVAYAGMCPRRFAAAGCAANRRRLSDRVRLPQGQWQGEGAARDILARAGKGRAFGCLGSLITRKGGQQVPYGSALALTATICAWSTDTGTPVPQLARTAIR